MTTGKRYTRRMTAPGLITADELERLPETGKHTELVRGHLIVSEPPGFQHGEIVVTLAAIMKEYVRARNLGRVLAETGFVLATNPDTVRGPDISFVRRERVPDPIPRGFARFSPDLAIEVLSPDDRPGKVLEKVADYLSAGTQLIWVVDPDRGQARVYRADGTVSVIGESDRLDGEDVLPGFSCALAQVLD
jgi:Uma2 family endonuclease